MRILKSLRRNGLALFLVLTMCLSLLPTTAFAADGKIPLTIKVKDSICLYDGTVRVGEDSTQLEDWNDSTVTEVTISSGAYKAPEMSDAGTDVGEFNESVETPVTLFSHGVDVTDQYEITLIPGKLVILPRLIAVAVTAQDKVYDGSKTVPETNYELTAVDLPKIGDSSNFWINHYCGGTIIPGDTVDVTAGSVEFQSADVQYDSDGVAKQTVEARDCRLNNPNYTLKYEPNEEYDWGMVTTQDNTCATSEAAITPRPVTLTSGTKEFPYDGNSHTCEEVTVTGNGFVEGQGVECSNFTSVKEENASEDNKFDYTANAGTDLKNYTITPVYGKLTITKPEDPKPETVTVTFDSQGGSEISPVTVAKGTNLGDLMPANPTKDGEVFDEWYIKANGERFSKDTVVNEDITVVAEYKTDDPKPTVTVTFDSQGGSEISPVTVAKGTNLGDLMPANPTKDGEVFDEWYIKANGERFSRDTVVNEDITVVAEWKSGTPDEPTNEYDIEYKVLRANGEWDTLEDVSHGTYSEELTWAAIEEQVKDVVSSHEADGYKLLTDYTKPLTIADRGDGKKTVTIELYEDKVGKDENGQLTGEGDCVPDAYQAVVTYKVENGQFKDEQTARKYVIDLYKLDSDLTWKPIENPTLGETVAHARSEMVAFEGFKEDNWKGDVPAADTKAENGKEYTFAYEPEYKTFTVHYRLEGAETDLKVENVSIQCAQPFDGWSYANAIIMVDGKQYAMTSQSGAFVAEKVTDNMEAYVYYLADNKGDPTDPDNKGDGIPDAYQVRVEFKVEHGDWDNTTNDGKPRYAYVTNRDIDGKPVPFGTEGSHAKLLEGQIPAVGHNPEKPGYCADGAWDADLDVEFTSTDVNRSFTFVYVKASLNVTKSAALTVKRAEPENEGEQGKVTACYVDYTVTLTNENLGPQYFVELRDVMQRGLVFDLDNLNFVLNGSPVEGLESEVRPIEYNVTDNHSQENSQATIYFQLVKNGQDGTFFDNGDVITVTYKATVDLTSDVFRDADGNALEDEALLTSIKDLYNHVYATTWDKSWDTPAAE